MMTIKIEIIKDKNLPKEYMNIMNKWRKKDMGPKEVKNFKRDYWPGAKFFFVKDNGEIVAFGGLRNVTINYLGKKYQIFGICNICSIKKRKGYGKILVQSMIKYLKKKGKTGLGFCGNKVSKFYRKSGLKIKKSFSPRFALKNPKTGEIKLDSDICYGVYYEGKDKLIRKVLLTKSTGYYYLPDVKEPHF